MQVLVTRVSRKGSTQEWVPVLKTDGNTATIPDPTFGSMPIDIRSFQTKD
jgi:hypothetical protein